MNSTQAIETAKTKLSAATAHFEQELKKLRTGRAHPSMLDGISVESYGQAMPLKAVASVTAPEGQLLQITPFDPSNLQAIAEAIRNDQSLGLTPADDGRVVRINLPPLTSEGRQALVKVLHQKVEECAVSVRQIRHEVRETLAAAQKNKEIGQDELARFEKQIDELLGKQKAQVDELAKAKEQEITTV